MVTLTSSLSKDATLGEVVQILEQRGPPYGYILIVIVKLIDGPNKGTLLRKKVSGFVKVGDIIPILDIETEAQPYREKKRR